jgi:RNA polymerase sigma-70 factor, ECF subfamily
LDPSDDQLIARARAGDTAAFDTLVTRYRQRIYAMTLNLIRHEADARDVAQETFIRAWRSIGRFEGKSCFFTWLYRIAHNLCCDRARARRLESDGEFDDSRGLPVNAMAAHLPRVSERPDDALSRSELRRLISGAIDQLSPEHRAVILLKEVQGLSYMEIAAAVSCSVGTVMSRLFYARRRLQTLLSGELSAGHR